MSPSRKSNSKAASRAEPVQRQRRYPIPRLDPAMACDTAFRVVARRCLGDLTASHQATCKGDPTALHQMRIALARLRAAILFFSPMVADSKRTQIRAELKWLNTHLGAVRDLDVAIERLKAVSKQRAHAISNYRSWNGKRADSHRYLARALRSARYRRLVNDTSGWVENGPWSIKKGKQATQDRACPVAAYSAGKLARWQQKLLKKRRRLLKMDAEKRHRLRLLNKKLSYSIELLEDLSPYKGFSKQQTALKHLRKAQRSLGQLNDDARGQSLAAASQRDGAGAPLQFLALDPKREKLLIRTAAAAYRKLAALKPFRT
jgi:CHAD domain-containing protein